MIHLRESVRRSNGPSIDMLRNSDVLYTVEETVRHRMSLLVSRTVYERTFVLIRNQSSADFLKDNLIEEN